MTIRMTISWWFILSTQALLGSAAFAQVAPGEFREINPVAAPAAGEVLAIVGPTLIDGRGGAPVKDAVVIVRGTRIEAAGPKAQVSIPSGAKRTDAAGLTLLPGFVDTHLHTGRSPEIPPIFLRAGVTTGRDPGVGLDRYDIAIGRGLKIPRMFLTGLHFDQEPVHHPLNAIVINNAPEAAAAVNRFADAGATGIKIYYRLPVELIRATCVAADARGIPVIAHLELVDADRAIDAGLDGIEHVTSVGTAVAEPAVAEAFRASIQRNKKVQHADHHMLWASLDLDSPRVQRMVRIMAERGVVFSPTMTYFFGHGPGSKQPTEVSRRAFANMLGFVGKCHEAGVKITVGSHMMLTVEPEGKAFQREMEFLVEAGMSPMDTLVAAMMEGARYLRAEKRVGSIEPGKLADLILIAGDPLKNIRATRNIRRVMLNGVWIGDAAPESKMPLLSN